MTYVDGVVSSRGRQKEAAYVPDNRLELARRAAWLLSRAVRQQRQETEEGVHRLGCCRDEYSIDRS